MSCLQKQFLMKSKSSWSLYSFLDHCDEHQTSLNAHSNPSWNYVIIFLSVLLDSDPTLLTRKLELTFPVISSPRAVFSLHFFIYFPLFFGHFAPTLRISWLVKTGVCVCHSWMVCGNYPSTKTTLLLRALCSFRSSLPAIRPPPPRQLTSFSSPILPISFLEKRVN